MKGCYNADYSSDKCYLTDIPNAKDNVQFKKCVVKIFVEYL